MTSIASHAATSESNDRANDAVERAINANKHLAGPVLPILHAIQDEIRFIPRDAAQRIADALNLSHADVEGVISFYHDFRRSPPGRHVLKVCRAEACQSMGSEKLEAHLKARLGIDFGQTTADGAITIEPVYCLGNCACSPAVLLDGKLEGWVDPERCDALLAALDGAAHRAASPVVASEQSSTVSSATSSSAPPVVTTASAPVATTASAAPTVAASRSVASAPNQAPATKLYVSRDASALSRGADDVAARILEVARARGESIDIVRMGSRGMFWLEPLVEVATSQGRVAYGSVAPDDVKDLFAAGFLTGGGGKAHKLHLGETDQIPYFKKQERLTFARVGLIDPLDIAAYEAHGGLRGLRAALATNARDIVETVVQSGLRGRGGAAFPCGIKWRTVLGAPALPKYVVCNADEGDSGTFSDRMIMEGDPFVLLEGMAIAGLAVGATKGFIYLRSEYPDAERTLVAAIATARKAGLLGADLLGSGRGFDVEIRRGAGAYICGEETALLESLEGKRGMVRPKPPLPAIEGLFGRPTVVNNVITLASVPIILDKGAKYYADYGRGRSQGTLPFQLAGNVKNGGLVEKAFGITLRELLYDYGGGTATGRPIRAVQVGGPLGAYIPESKFDTPLDYEAFAAVGGMIGHGGVVVFDDTVDMAKMARYAMEFCAIESCGKCTPCRIGSTRGVEVIDNIRAGKKAPQNLVLLRDLCDTMTHGSLCAMGGLTPSPVLSALDHFSEDFGVSRAGKVS
jgi:formate dehydrogenase iron-sulfur subunit